MDVRDMSAFEDNSFDAVIDKGTKVNYLLSIIQILKLLASMPPSYNQFGPGPLHTFFFFFNLLVIGSSSNIPFYAE